MHNLPKNLSNQSKSFQYGSDPVSAKIFVFIMSQICFQQEFVAEYSAKLIVIFDGFRKRLLLIAFLYSVRESCLFTLCR